MRPSRGRRPTWYFDPADLHAAAERKHGREGFAAKVVAREKRRQNALKRQQQPVAAAGGDHPVVKRSKASPAAGPYTSAASPKLQDKAVRRRAASLSCRPNGMKMWRARSVGPNVAIAGSPG